MHTLSNIYWLGTKEIRSFFHDFVLLGLVIYAFSLAIFAQAQSNAQEVHNASVAVLDEDHSVLSQRMIGALLPPYFKKPQPITDRDIDYAMDTGRYTFVIVIPPHFERDVLAGHLEEDQTLWASVQVNVDATAMVQAGLGSGYIQQILTTEVQNFVSHNEGDLLSRSQNIPMSPVTLAVRILFNPNADSSWFMSVMGIVNNVTMLAIILAGAAVVREREHGTMDHLLVMPVTPFEIAMAKIWANGLIITVTVGLSLILVVRGLLHIPIIGSVPLFVAGTALYLFFATAVGIYLATIARTMPQLGLLYMLVAMPLNMLSGSMTPLESMPMWLRTIMQMSPSTYFVSYAQAILFRGAGFAIVWPKFLAVGLIGSLFLFLALRRFRKVAAQTLG
ncbi:ABC transporter permease [Methylovirgula sp. HY1]|uniref:ABC transporter permease n=1 Tax=Methylovirgula sp. HY1 TaxID=2822761 RepID=UPI001C5BA985|nr:ABC transporter permease [Methylovirgula sp. HY1]